MNYHKTYMDSEQSSDFGRLILSEYFSGARRILDAGCGNGWFTMTDTERITGIDAHPPAIKGAKIYRRNILDSGFKTGFFDAVFCSHVIEHFEHPGEVVREFGRLLKKGGTAVIIVPHKTRSFDPDHKTFFDAYSLRALLEKNGFSCDTFEFVGLKTLRFFGIRVAWFLSKLIPYFGFHGAVIAVSKRL